MKLTSKQLEVVNSIKEDDPKILICSGAKRAGKTWILIYAFIGHVAKFENMSLSFILGGTTQASLRRNVINDLEVILNREIVLSKDNSFMLFGNKIYCFDGANSDSYKKLRGFTSAGAFLNEATTLNDSFVKEAISRCSYKGARIYMDTNPENPTHTVKVDYIDKTGQRLNNGKLNIKAFNFTLYDNDKLDSEYIESIVKSTPSGMFSDRDIYGLWVSAEGVVYKDFDRNKHYIKENEIDYKKVIKYFCGVDWGYEHYGSIVLIAKDSDSNYYFIREYSAKHKEIDYWVNIAQEIKKEYGNIKFYADSARPEHVQRFKREGLHCENADKSVLSGIEIVSKLLKLNKLKIIEDNVDMFKSEIYNYVWKNGKDEPVKTNDDILDALRYAIYSESVNRSIRTVNKNSIF